MTVESLTSHLNETYGLNKWPDYHRVDADTYANVCQYLFQEYVNTAEEWHGFFWRVCVSVGPWNNGIMFKNVELILDNKP